MQDYILSEEYKESEEVIVTDECGTKWYKSKDIGRVNEDGMLFIDDRLKRIITRRGFKIYPEHIESIIRQNEYVEDCVVVGIYDEDEISIPVANIILKEEVKYNEDSVTIVKNLKGEYLLVVADGMGGHKAGEIASSVDAEKLIILTELQTFLRDTLRFGGEM